MPNLHTNFCGDFQLMSRPHWHFLRGYRESNMIGLHVDSLLSYASYAAGVKEVVLNDPLRLYHIDHDSGIYDRLTEHLPLLEQWMSAPLLPKFIGRRLVSLYRRLAGDHRKNTIYGIPVFSFSDYWKLCGEVISGKRPCVFNSESWGLGDQTLPETLLVQAEWDLMKAR